MKCGLYKIVNKTNGKFYIGSSVNMPRRFNSHILDLTKNKHDNQHLQHSWNKYGKDSFIFEVYRTCEPSNLLIEEQKELDCWVGKDECYNMRKDAKCPISPGEHRSNEVKKKISLAQKGKPRFYARGNKWSLGRKHTPQTIKKMKNRQSSFNNIQKAQLFNTGRIYSREHCLHIKNSKLGQFHNSKDREKISVGVNKAISEGRYHKNKVHQNEHENIKSLYLSGSMNKRQLSFKYGINPSSMQKLLTRIGI